MPKADDPFEYARGAVATNLSVGRERHHFRKDGPKQRSNAYTEKQA